MKEHVIINLDRTVNVPESMKKIGIQYDHNVKTITFDCPRYPDENPNVDMSTMKIFINWMLPDKTLGSTIATNVCVDSKNENLMHFDWVITRVVTSVSGVLSTLICIKETTEAGEETYHWNTELIQSFKVGNGMECTEQIVEQNIDVITQLLVRMDAVDARTSTEAMQGYVDTSVNTYLNQNPITPTDEQATTGINTYMNNHAQGCVNNYLTEHPISPTEEQMKQGVAANSEMFQSSVDDYLGRNPLQLDNGLTETTKAAPANKVGEIQSDVTELKGDIAENKQEITSVRNDVNGIINETVTTGINVFDYSKVELYKQINKNGEIVNSSSTSGVCMKEIAIPQGTNEVVSIYKKRDGTEMITDPNMVIYHFYNNNMYLGEDIGGKVVTIPSNAKTIVIQTHSSYSSVLKNLMVAFDDHQIPYEEYTEVVKESRLGGIEKKIEYFTENMIDKAGTDQITKENASFIDKVISKNMFDKTKATIGYTVNIDGGILEKVNRAVSDYIPCEGKTVFSVATGGEGVYAFYDENKTYLSPYKEFKDTGLVNLSIPSNAKYLRVSLKNVSIDTFMVVFDSEVGNYEKYGIIYKLSEDVGVKIEDKTPKGIIDFILASGGQIKFIGDSITHGVGGTGFSQDGQVIVPDSDTFHVNTNGYCHVNLFKKYINEKYGNTVLNFGTRGVRSYDIKSFLQKNGYITDDDKLIVCMIGTNNKWATESSTIEDFKKDLQYIIDWCAERDKKLIFVSAPMSNVQYDTTYSDGSLVKFHNEDIDHAYKEVCYKNGMGYIPMYQKMVEYCDLKDIEISTIFSDGLHPNDKGYYIMYKILMRELGLAYQLPKSSWDDASPTT